MNDTTDPGKIKSDAYEWRKEANNTYTRTMSIYYRHRTDTHILETNITEKEYFRRRLDGTAQGTDKRDVDLLEHMCYNKNIRDINYED